MVTMHFYLLLLIYFLNEIFYSIVFPVHKCDIPNKIIHRPCYNMSNTTDYSCSAGSAYTSGALNITSIVLVFYVLSLYETFRFELSVLCFLLLFYFLHRLCNADRRITIYQFISSVTGLPLAKVSHIRLLNIYKL